MEKIQDPHYYKMDASQILELLKTEIREEENLRSAIRTTMNIYVTILIAILGGIATLTATTYSNINHTLLGILLSLGGILVFFIAYAALKHYISDYRRQAETIVQEAKLEDLLGMADASRYSLKAYWKGEALLPHSFIESRKRFDSSKDFVEWFISATDTKIARILYFVFLVIGIAIFFLGLICIIATYFPEMRVFFR